MQDQKLSNQTFLDVMAKHVRLSFERYSSQSEGVLKPLLLKGRRPASFQFDWGWDTPPGATRNFQEIDVRAAQHLLKCKCFHHHSHIVLKLGPAKIKKQDGSRTSYISTIRLFVRNGVAC